MVIRDRQPADDPAILALNEAAFGGGYEAALVADLRSSGLAVVELVACDAQEITGHIMFSRLAVSLDARAIRALALAPMAVRPGRQRKGIGSTLVREGLARARERAWQAILVLGHPHFYPRFGFSAALAAKLQAPFSGEAFMALALERDALSGATGSVVYPAPFGLDRAS